MNTKHQDTAIVVMGIDKDGNPHAVTYSPDLEQVAVDSAAHWGMRMAKIVDDKGLALAKNLPDGSLFPAPKMEPPTIKRATYNALVKIVGFESKPAKASMAVSSTLFVGSVVIAPEKDPAEDGWWPAVVVAISKDGKNLTLKWRDHKLPPFHMKRSEIAVPEKS